jgi:hypothetical protein
VSFGCRVVASLSHVEILRRGPQAWNEWRAQNPAERPHLSHVTLSLSERQWGPMHGGPINLKSAILPDASLRFASLLDADLQAADLTRADLVHARLDRANLKNAILTDALLDHADFADAHLSRAILSGASLSHARNLTQDQIDETVGDASTTLPAHLERPAAWLEVAPEPPPSPTFYRKALIAGASACVIAGIVLLGVPRDEQHLEPTASATKTHQVEQPPAFASSQARGSSTTTPNALPSTLNEPDQDSKQSTSESMTSPDKQQAELENSGAILTPPESTEALVGRSASSNENLTIGFTVRVEGVLGLNVHEDAATARVELKSPVAALASLGSSERWPSIALSTPAALRDTPAANELRATPSRAETAPPLPDRKPVIVQSPAKSKVAIPAHVKPLPRATRRPEVVQQPIQVKPSSSTADVLAGGL